MSLEDLALLEVLQRIDQHVVLTDNDNAMRQRMIDGALIEEGEYGLSLTAAGIELCKSLQHRLAADQQAAKITQQREDDAAGQQGTQVPQSHEEGVTAID
ncbi:hypothetical protein [Cognatiluteimonas telluris]|uniref:hypothetical protein n=1 Tax=Cognatiluteimonas telluris TaxID=1104775 RepID=UPI001407AB2F|nr:hypothetical protein [Lysobacter telluris]